VEFSQGDAPVEYIGPFEEHRVVVSGWEVPLLEATFSPGGMVSLTLDRRFGLDVPVADAERVVPFLANAIAIALGYAAHPRDDMAEPKPLPVVRPRRLRPLSWTERGEAVVDGSG
jgi:hypothetical protein